MSDDFVERTFERLENRIELLKQAKEILDEALAIPQSNTVVIDGELIGAIAKVIAMSEHNLRYQKGAIERMLAAEGRKWAENVPDNE
jgi:hypothetical protein